ncbi:MAG: phosphomannomutase/phosphoglucomutase [Planctomycetota bacterium]|jgi:phosphomannomutase
MSIFKAYDIRGIYGSELNEALAERIGRAFVAEIGPRTVVVGHDMRPCAPSIRDAFVRGATAAGADVTRIGLASTPMLNFALGHGGFDAGVMITASHNPAEYIGLKMAGREAVPISGETGIKAIGERATSGNLPEDAETPGSVSDTEFHDPYVHMVVERARFKRRMKVVADAANAMGGFEFPLVARHLDMEVIPLYFELDGSFPNHEANPLKIENLKVLRETVLRENADLGVSFDGDADRAGFVDETGEVVTNDLATALMAGDVLGREKGPVVYDLRSSRALPEEIERHGGTPIRCRVGHSFMKEAMRKHRCVYGGEYSGHYYFRENYNTESASLAVVSICNIIAGGDRTLSELLRPLRRYLQTGEVNFRVEDKMAKMKEVEAAFPDAETDWLDGVTVQYPDWFCNVRPSNTEPLLRLNLEARDEPTFQRAKQKVVGILGDPV